MELRGRPKRINPKIAVNMRLEPDIIGRLRAHSVESDVPLQVIVETCLLKPLTIEEVCRQNKIR